MSKLDAEEIQGERERHILDELRYWMRQYAETGDAGAQECLNLARQMNRAALDAEHSLRMRVNDINHLRTSLANEGKPASPSDGRPKDDPLWRA